jgi:hypothetical protein
MITLSCGPLFDIQFFDIIAYDPIYVELHRPLDRLSYRLCSHLPARRKPAGRTFHSYAEFG